jgi:hypothetical protein
MSQLKVDTITNEAGTGSPSLPNGLTVGGVNYPSTGPLSNRNKIINGAMQVAQRGNRSPSGFTGSFYAGPDRWLVSRSGSGDTGFGQISSTNYGGTKAAEATFLAAAGETFIVAQRIEAANIAHLAGQPVTLSFWVSGSNDAGSSTLDASISYAGSSDNFTSETVIGSPQSIAYTGTAQRVTMTVTLPSGAANGVSVRLTGEKTGATGTFTLIFGGVQLEAGDTATPFEHRSFGQELALCQRYYWQGVPRSVAGGLVSANPIQARFGIKLRQTMRSVPTISGIGTFAIDDYFAVFADGGTITTSAGTNEQFISLQLETFNTTMASVPRPVQIHPSATTAVLVASAEL